MRPNIRRTSLAAAVGVLVFSVPGVASAADPAPVDRTKPVITNFKVTPTLTCHNYAGEYANERRTVSFTLSEPARVRLIKLPLAFYVIPAGFTTGVTIPLAAGTHSLWSAALGDVAAPGIFPFEYETLREGYFGIEAKDAAGNKSSTKWSRYLRAGETASGKGPATNGC